MQNKRYLSIKRIYYENTEKITLRSAKELLEKDELNSIKGGEAAATSCIVKLVVQIADVSLIMHRTSRIIICLRLN